MKAAIYTRVSAVDLPGAADEQLATLRALVAARGWMVDLITGDLGLHGRRPGLDRLRRWVDQGRGPGGRVVVVTSLPRLFRSLADLAFRGSMLEQAGVGLVAVQEGIDTTNLAGATRFHELLAVLRGFSEPLRSEAVRLARIAAMTGRRGDAWGRPVAAVNPQEVARYWEGSPTLRPLSVRQLAAKLKLSRSTVSLRIAEYVAAGRLSPAKREAHLALHGGLPRGGRPSRRKRLSDRALLDLIRDTNGDLDAGKLAKRARISKSELLARLQGLGLRRKP